jgi:hypothetical protein
MPDYCTILCAADEPQRVVALVRELVGRRGNVSVRGKVANWSSITVRGAGASLVLNRRVFRKQADEFSKMRNCMWVYFESVKTKRKKIKADVLRRVEEHALAVGVVAEPEFVEEAGHNDFIFGLAAALGAIIWDGSGVLNAEGQLLLDSEGNCEVAG